LARLIREAGGIVNLSIDFAPIPATGAIVLI
jgi:hypothetical protein